MTLLQGMGKLIDLTGQTFGKWEVIRRAGISGPKQPLWVCRCSCGTVRPVLGQSLRDAVSTSCGCELPAQLAKLNIRHGLTSTPVHEAWSNMRSRCENSKNIGYKNYGGRGIRVCERWQSFDNFLADMGIPPEGGSIDRIDNDRGYEPGNCRWATRTEQARNKRDTLHVTYQGRTQSLPTWCEELGLRYMRVYQRLAAGWTVEDAFTKPGLRG